MSSSKFSNFYIKSGLFFGLSLSGAVLNYALYIALARVLSVRDFGDFAVIIAISNQVLGVLLALNLASIYLVKTNKEAEARRQLQIIQKVLVWVFLGLIILISLASPLLADWLKIAEPVSFIVLALMLLATIPSIIWTGYLQGHKKLIDVGIYNLSSSSFKFVLAIILGAAGGVVGGVMGVLLGVVFGLITLKLFTRIEMPSIASVFTKLTSLERQAIRDLRPYIIGAIFVVGLLSILQNIDITYAKILFSPEIAGLYSGVSVISYAIYYVSLMLVWIILPEISANNPSHNKRLLVTSYKILVALAAGIVLTITVFKDTLVPLLLGDAFKAQADILIYASLYQISLVCVTLYAYYLLVLRNKQAYLLGACIVLPAALLPWIRGDTPKDMIVSLWLSILMGMVLYFIISTVTKSVRSNEQTID